MAKVIVERPRYGRGLRFPRHDLRDPDAMPRKMGIRKPWVFSGHEKGLNENLAPLFRYLERNAGRPWDAVYSEIRERINMNSAVQMHIWQHVTDYVCQSAEIVQTPRGKRFAQLDRSTWRHNAPFVVNPRTGILLKDPDYWSRRKYRPTPKLEAVLRRQGRVFKEIEGIWYELDLVRVSKEIETDAFDLVAREYVVRLPKQERLRLYGDEKIYAASKRQLNTKEIRLLDLEKKD